MNLKLIISKPFSLAPPLQVNRPAVLRLTFCLSLVIGWHIGDIPFWAILGGFAFNFWRFLHDYKGISLPGKKMKFIITAIAFVTIYLHFGNYLGRDPGICALILFSSIKLLELKSPRDFMVVVFFCFFLLLGSFLYDQAITTFIFMLILTVLLISAMLRLNLTHNQFPKKRYLIKTAGRYLVFIIPIAICLFLFFPRTRGFFFSFRSSAATTGVSGIRDHISPGRVARIAQSNATAFRVFFPDNNMPAYRNLYFRGLVLWFTDGKEWWQGRFRTRPAESDLAENRAIRQEIILEPHNQYWLFALDTPHVFPGWAKKTTGQVFGITQRIKRRMRYKVASTINYQPSDSLHPILKRYALQIPRRPNPRLQTLVDNWISRSESPQEIVRIALDYFRTSGFTYTLQPGELNRENPIEDFVFNTKSGFCEHYATTFTLLMRMADIPARIILGYHGGKYNEVGKYLTIRQMDAHAWTEIWLEGAGWQRIDPTSVVSPSRIELGIEYSDNLASTLAGGASDTDTGFSARNRGGFLKRTMRWFDDLWETIKIQWSYWIMSYDRFQQWDFLSFLGSLKNNALGLVVITIALVFFLIIIIKTILRREALAIEPLVRLYQLFCLKLARKNLARILWEGPLDFKNRACKALPAKAEEISAISNLFIRLRYGEGPATPTELKQFKEKIKKFKP